MATSGLTVFTLTALEVVNKAFGKIGVKVAEQELTADEYQDGQDSLNLMIKSWGAQGLHLWSKEEGLLFLDAGKTDYLLGATGDKACQFDDFIGTTSAADNIATDVIIQVASTDGMAIADRAGIELDDNTRFWSTILTVDSATQITITTQLPSPAASGATVFTFTDLVARPNRILSYRRNAFGNDNEIPVITWSRQSYFDQVNKQSQGTIVNAYYSPQLDNGRVWVWQTASSVNDLIRFTFERPLEDITDGDQTLDFPAEWLEAIIYNLAARLVDDYDAPIQKAEKIAIKAVSFLDDLLGWDEEMTSLNLQPDF
ncbi:MAG: hypothetical protein V3R49_02750 [Gammaproteobacteria bacterium]